jgi:hypothetical protein
VSIEVCESEERLNVLDLLWLQPFLDCLDLIVGHSESIGGKNVTEIFHGVGVEFTLVGADIYPMVSESLEDFLDLSPVLFFVIGVNEDVVQVYKDADIKQVHKDVIYKSLKCSWSIGKSERYDTPFEGAISGSDIVFHSSPSQTQTR